MNKKIMMLPIFKNEDEERDFWAKHDLMDYFSKPIKMKLPNLKLSNELISLRLPLYLLDTIKKEAHRRDMPYQSLMKAKLYDIFMEKKDGVKIFK
jgi:predicted DNA binding CopG/RHH family protein